MMKKVFLIVALLFASIVSAQTAIIEGTVKDTAADNAPMMFAKVTVKETKQSMTTGYRGGYFFKDLKPGKYTLIFDFLGYQSMVKEVEVLDSKVVVDASLKQTTDINFETIQLSEITN